MISHDQLPDSFADFFEDKVETIHSTISSESQNGGSNTPMSSDVVLTGSKLTKFEPVSQEEVRRLVNKAPNKSCSLDPLPT